MNGSLPDDVIREMQDIMNEMGLFDTPPEGAFTVKDYYEEYISQCDEKEIRQDLRLKLDGVRRKLDIMVDDGKLESGKFTMDGSATVFFWPVKEK
jgi:hypothetical protein